MDLLTIQRKPPIRVATLDTGKRNPLNLEAVRALRDAVEEDRDDPVLVLKGRDDGFCCGLDNATLAASDVEREELLTATGELLLAALSGPTRIVAACTGHAVAAGAMLLLVADVRIGVPGTYKIGFTEPSLGMPLPELPALLARQRLDRRRLHELTVLGRTVGPDEAAQAGFLDAVVAADRLDATALERAREIASLSDTAYRGSLAAVWRQTMARMRALLDEQNRRLAAVRGRPA